MKREERLEKRDCTGNAPGARALNCSLLLLLAFVTSFGFVLPPFALKTPPKATLLLLLTATLERVLEAPPALSRAKLRRQRSTLVTRGWGGAVAAAEAAAAEGTTSAAEARQARAAEAASNRAVERADMMNIDRRSRAGAGAGREALLCVCGGGVTAASSADC